MERLKLRIQEKSAQIFKPTTIIVLGILLFCVGFALAESPQETYGRWLWYLPYTIESKISLFAIVAPLVMFPAGFILVRNQIVDLINRKRGEEKMRGKKDFAIAMVVIIIFGVLAFSVAYLGDKIFTGDETVMRDGPAGPKITCPYCQTQGINDVHIRECRDSDKKSGR